MPGKFAYLLEYILVAQLINSKDKQHGDVNTNINLLKDCIYLDKEGIQLQVGNQTIRVYFVLGLIQGDNLGMHEVLGFPKSFVSNKILNRNIIL